MTIINECPLSQWVWHSKEPLLLNGHKSREWVKICNPSPAMVTSPYEWKILQRDENPQTNKQTNKQKHDTNTNEVSLTTLNDLSVCNQAQATQRKDNAREQMIYRVIRVFECKDFDNLWSTCIYSLYVFESCVCWYFRMVWYMN